jgi:protein SCO1/2
MTEKDFAGRRAVVFFGYTYCPDVCPIALFNLGKAMADVPEAKRPVTIFVSVDPRRDTPEKLDQFIHSNGFPKDIVALTGSLDQLSAMSEHFPPRFEPGEPGPDGGGYLVGHSSILYVMDKDWKLQTFFRDTEAPKTIASCLSALS